MATGTHKPRWTVRAYNTAQRIRSRVLRAPRRFAEREAELLERACRATGLDDFGEPDFLEHLRVLLRAYDDEARLTPFGRMMVGRELVGILRARLAVEHAWREDPRLLDAPIRRPLFILGLPRSGTTALHHLLAEDPQNQVLEYWLAAAPGPRPPRRDWRRDPRYKAAVRGLRAMYSLDPSLKAIHLMTADRPDECRHLFVQSFLDHTFDHNASVPSYTKWFEAQDMRAAYARHRDTLNLIGARSPERRWVLKYPSHLKQLDVLLEIYPDACIVQTHRDPARVLPSICSLVSGWRRLYEGDVDACAIARWQTDFLAGMMERAMTIRGARDPAQFFDLPFHEIAADPVAAVARIYDHFGFELGAEAERRMVAYCAVNLQDAHGGHRYSSEEFGLAPEQVVERFATYTKRFDVREEARV